MDFYVLTLFPEMVEQGLHTSILGRAAERKQISIHGVNIRDYSEDRRQKADDYTYGGGAGMLMQAQPVFDAHRAVTGGRKVRTIYVTPQGTPFTQKMARELACEEELVFLCGHYEGIDERVLEEIVTDYLSIGDYILTGGELPAMVMIDAIARLVPGVLHNESSACMETFHNDLLEYPQYTRPEEWHGKKVPSVLLSGDHRAIAKWRLERSQERTARIRPDLYARYQEKQRVLAILGRQKRNHIHMMELLDRGNGEVLYAKEADILLHDTKSGAYLLAAESREGFEPMLERIPSDASLFVTTQEFMNQPLIERFGVAVENHCFQACYTRREQLPVRHRDIRLLGEEYLEYMAERYHCGGREYLLDRLRDKAVYGIFVEGQIAGFAGIHDDGSMGMLFVQESFRGMGLAMSLEAFLINYLKEKGYTPYCQVFTDNNASISLQERLGLYLSSGTIWWLTGK